jgi:hypothetical protein
MALLYSMAPPSQLTIKFSLSNSTPSLHPRYQTSSLIRADPPLFLSSVLSSSRFFPLGFLLLRLTAYLLRRLFRLSQGDRFPSSIQEPKSDSRRLNAGRHLGSKQVFPQTYPSCPGGASGFDVSLYLSTLHQRFTCVRLPDLHMTHSLCAFLP